MVSAGGLLTSSAASGDTPKGRGRGGPSPGGGGGPPPSKRPKVTGAGRGTGGKGGAASAPAVPALPPVEAGYQSDEEDTAIPMSYDEKRQVSSFYLSNQELLVDDSELYWI